jgi:DNA-binding MarR family transcriptional regulator
VLSSLRVRGRGFGTTPIELNRFAQITSAGMTRTLDRLEESGYIERSPNPDDRRSILIRLTNEGWDFAETLGEDLNAPYAEALDDLSAEQLKTEIGQLRVIVERLAQAVIG